MTKEDEALLFIVGEIEGLSHEKQTNIASILIQFERLADRHGLDCFTWAVSYISAKLAAKLT